MRCTVLSRRNWADDRRNGQRRSRRRCRRQVRRLHAGPRCKMCHLSPPFLRAEVRGTLVKALPHLHAALVAGRADGVTAGRVWKLCLLEWNNRACKAGRYSSRGRKRSSAGVLKRHPSSTRRFYTSTDVLQYLKLQATQPLVFKRSGDTRQETCHCGAVGNECEHLKLLCRIWRHWSCLQTRHRSLRNLVFWRISSLAWPWYRRRLCANPMGFSPTW